MKEAKKIEKTELTKSLDYLMEVAKSGGTQIAQGRQKAPSHPNPEEQHIDDYKDSKFEDKLDENGTDYKHQEELSESSAIGEDSDDEKEHELMEGDQFAAGRAMKLKGKMSKAQKDDDHEDEEQDKKLMKEMMKKKDKKVSKSFEEELEQDETITKGLEVSDFLAHFAKSQVGAIANLEAKVDALITALSGKQDRFNGGLAKAVKALGDVVMETSQRIAEVEGQPLPPKSKLTIVEKSFGTQAEQAAQPSKKEILDKLVAGVESGKLSPNAAIKFETVGQLGEEAKTFLKQA